MEPAIRYQQVECNACATPLQVRALWVRDNVLWYCGPNCYRAVVAARDDATYERKQKERLTHGR